MKKVLWMLLLLVQGTLGAVGQQVGKPIQPYRESGYTPSEVKNFAYGNSQLSVGYRSEMVRLVNVALAAAGENITVTEKDIGWILDNVHSEHVDLNPKSFKNSRDLYDVFDTYLDREGFKGDAGIFEWGKCKIVLYKTICMNLLNVFVNIFKQKDPTPPTSPSQSPPLPFGPGLGTPTLPQATGGQKMNESVQELGVSSKTKTEEKQRGKFGAWIKDHPIASGLITGGIITGVGFIAHDNNHNWYLWFPKGSRVTNPGHDDVPTDEGGRKTNPGHY